MYLDKVEELMILFAKYIKFAEGTQLTDKQQDKLKRVKAAYIASKKIKSTKVLRNNGAIKIALKAKLSAWLESIKPLLKRAIKANSDYPQFINNLLPNLLKTLNPKKHLKFPAFIAGVRAALNGLKDKNKVEEVQEAWENAFDTCNSNLDGKIDRYVNELLLNLDANVYSSISKKEKKIKKKGEYVLTKTEANSVIVGLDGLIEQFPNYATIYDIVDDSFAKDLVDMFQDKLPVLKDESQQTLNFTRL
jgi:hypothetical protein